MTTTSNPVHDAAVFFGRLAERDAARDRAIGVEVSWIAEQLGTPALARTVKVKPFWSAYGTKEVAIGREFVAWLVETHPNVDEAMTSLLFDGLGRFHPLIQQFGQEFAELEAQRGEFDDDGVWA